MPGPVFSVVTYHQVILALVATEWADCTHELLVKSTEGESMIVLSEENVEALADMFATARDLNRARAGSKKTRGS